MKEQNKNFIDDYCSLCEEEKKTNLLDRVKDEKRNLVREKENWNIQKMVAIALKYFGTTMGVFMIILGILNGFTSYYTLMTLLDIGIVKIAENERKKCKKKEPVWNYYNQELKDIISEVIENDNSKETQEEKQYRGKEQNNIDCCETKLNQAQAIFNGVTECIDKEEMYLLYLKKHLLTRKLWNLEEQQRYVMMEYMITKGKNRAREKEK